MLLLLLVLLPVDLQGCLAEVRMVSRQTCWVCAIAGLLLLLLVEPAMLLLRRLLSTSPAGNDHNDSIVVTCSSRLSSCMLTGQHTLHCVQSLCIAPSVLHLPQPSLSSKILHVVVYLLLTLVLQGSLV